MKVEAKEGDQIRITKGILKGVEGIVWKVKVTEKPIRVWRAHVAIEPKNMPRKYRNQGTLHPDGTYHWYVLEDEYEVFGSKLTTFN